jgi:aspartate racemase
MKHIGIVAHSAEGAALCYRTICQEGFRILGPHQHPEVTMNSIAMSESMPHWERGEEDAIGQILLRSVRRLAAAGADFFVCPDNTAHLAWGELERNSPLPYLHIVEVVASEAQARGYKRLGVLGTRFTMDGPVYRRVLEARGIGCDVPDADLRREINSIIFEELVNGLFRDSSRQLFVEAIEQLAARGCDAVVLGCTEIPLLIAQSDSPLPVLDSTRLLARAAVRHAVEATP